MSAATRRTPANAQPRARRQTAPAVYVLAAWCLCVAALACAFVGVFTVKHVNVVGDNLPISTIVQASGAAGENIFTLQTDQVIARLHLVRSVAVSRVESTFPDQITIHATRRQAMVAWQTPSGLFLVDRDGNVIAQTRSTNLPVITGITDTGHQMSLSPGIVQAVGYAVQSLPTASRGGILAFRFDRNRGLSIMGKLGWQAIVGSGSPQALVQRIATLAAFFTTIGTRLQQLKSVDLRHRDPVARFTVP